jgi:uncharacterized protein with ParB-like and HNH nuclease domain
MNDKTLAMNIKQQSNQMVEMFSELIDKYQFFIPNYQRAYSWTEKEIALFIADIAEHAEKKTQYYLGHYILEDLKDDNKMAIVDGQQRLTTVAIFLAICQHLKNSSSPLLPLRLTVVEYDDVKFKELLLPKNIKILSNQEGEQKEEATASLMRVVLAIHTFLKSFLSDKQHIPALLFENKIGDYIDVISKAAVSVGIYKNKAVASQIFELHNTRGVLLTETEKVKALLMKYVYLNSKNGNCDVDEIQKAFATVFELEEKASHSSFRGEMDLDEILAHHLRAIDDGKDKTAFTQPQSVEGENGCVGYVRKKILEGGCDAGIEYAKSLAREFAKTMELISKEFVEQDRNEPLIGDVILLDQRRSMIFLLRYFRVLPSDQKADHVLLKRWESFLFLWDFHDAFWNMKASKKDSFPEIFNLINKTDYFQIARHLEEYYSGKKDFAPWRPYQIEKNDENGGIIKGLDHVFLAYITRPERKDHLLQGAYNWGHWHTRYKYWLYKYEIQNASSDQADIRGSLRDLFKENNVTLDHIVPHALELKALSKKGETDNDIAKWKDADDRNEAEANWEKISNTIEGIGNLVLLSRSNNATLQNITPVERSGIYEKYGLKSISYKEVENWTNPDKWQEQIKARGERLYNWMKDYFTDQATWTDKVTK